MDDPTRATPIRKPCISVPHWSQELLRGSTDAIDEAAKSHDDPVPKLVSQYMERQAAMPDLATAPISQQLLVPNKHVSKQEVKKQNACRSPKTGSLGPPGPSASRNAPLPSSPSEPCGPQSSATPCGSKGEKDGGATLRVGEPGQKSRKMSDSSCSQAESMDLYRTTFIKLTPKAVALLQGIDPKAFVWKYRSAKIFSCKGVLDLFSGSRRYAKRCIKHGAPWVLCFDFLRDPVNQDLLRPKVRRLVEQFCAEGCYAAGGAGPPCSSFSTAITPPCRSRRYPRGKPDASQNMKSKMRIGNSHSRWLAELVEQTFLKMSWWVENPHGSFLWAQSEWRRIAKLSEFHVFVVDYCRFGMVYRKRTRILHNLQILGDQPVLCKGNHRHTILRGLHPSGQLWTNVAELYPFPFADILAIASCANAGFRECQEFDIGAAADLACQKCGRRSGSSTLPRRPHACRLPAQ